MGFTNEYEKNISLIRALYKQNPSIFDDTTDLEILEIIKSVKNIYVAKIRLDTSTFNRALSNKRVYIGWNSCYVYEFVNVWRCYKCQMFGHSAKDCKNEDHICPKCAHKHKVEECTNNFAQCINCKRANEQLKLDLPVTHYAFSSECQVLTRRTKQRQKFMRYTD